MALLLSVWYNNFTSWGAAKQWRNKMKDDIMVDIIKANSLTTDEKVKTMLEMKHQLEAEKEVTNNDKIRGAIRRIYCMTCADFIDLMDFANDDYAIIKFQQVQKNPALSLVDSLDEQHSDLLLNWALRK